MRRRTFSKRTLLRSRPHSFSLTSVNVRPVGEFLSSRGSVTFSDRLCRTGAKTEPNPFYLFTNLKTVQFFKIAKTVTIKNRASFAREVRHNGWELRWRRTYFLKSYFAESRFSNPCVVYGRIQMKHMEAKHRPEVPSTLATG